MSSLYISLFIQFCFIMFLFHYLPLIRIPTAVKRVNNPLQLVVLLMEVCWTLKGGGTLPLKKAESCGGT
jgi:hypothetical protein